MLMKQILIVEDSEPLQKVYSEVLTKEGFNTIIASDGPSGLRILRDKTVDLILLDIMLPSGMNGFDVMMRLRQNPKLQKIPVIILSNLDSERQACEEAGAIDYFIKSSMDVATLVAKIRSHLLPTESSQ